MYFILIEFWISWNTKQYIKIGNFKIISMIKIMLKNILILLINYSFILIVENLILL